MRHRELSSVTAASGLAILTLAVFGAAQNSGPESTIRRYHASLRAGSQEGVVVTTIDDINRSQIRFFHQQVAELLNRNPQIRLGQVQKSNGQGTVEVAYLLPNGETWAMLYRLQLVQGRWRIDVAATQAGLVPGRQSSQRLNY